MSVHERDGYSPPPVWRRPMVVAGIGLLGIFLLFDPARHALFPSCPLHAMTGLWCPGCGSQRALHHLLRGDAMLALRYNALFVAGVPALAVVGLLAWRGPARMRSFLRRFGGALLLACLAVAVLFGIARNVPAPPLDCLAPPADGMRSVGFSESWTAWGARGQGMP